MLAPTIGLPHDVVPDRDRVAARLQDALVDLVALGLNAKQAHWHVHGPHFLPVHQQLDTLVEDTRAWADLVAERAVALGVPVDGRPATVARDAGVDAFPTGFVEDGKVVALMAEQLDSVVLRLRRAVGELGELDAVTQDVVIEVLRGLEKHLWMLQAQRS
jgi:starvation-inducible DNA-binding protein